jgi:hypothetical protein
MGFKALRRRMLLATALVLISFPVVSMAASAQAATEDEDANYIGKTVDVALLRPLGAVRLAAGTALFIPVSFFNGLGQSSLAALGSMGLSSGANWSVFGESLDLLIVEPSQFLFVRPLGEDLSGD